MAPKYQYCLYGLNGAFMGITVSLKDAKAHRAKLPDIYYYRRYEFDRNDRDWSVATGRDLISNKGKSDD